MVIHGSTHPSVSSKVPKQASSKQQASQRCCMPISSAAQLRGTVPVTEPRFVFYLFFTFTKPPPDHKKHQIISSSCIALLRMPYYYCSSNNTGTARTHAHSRPNLVSYSLPTTTTPLRSAVCTVRTVPDSRSLARTTCCIIQVPVSQAKSPNLLLHRQTPPLPVLHPGRREKKRKKKKKRTLNMV